MSNAEEALALLESDITPPALLLVDLGLPGLSGFALVERVRSNPRWQRLPILVLTARDLSDEEHALLAKSVNLIAQKGLMTGEGFLDTVATLCHQVEEAAGGEVGVARAQSGPPQVILLDVRMPGIDGFEVMRQLSTHAQTRSIPIIAVSAQAMVGDRERALAAGYTAYVTKPMARQELLAAVDRALREGKKTS